MSHSIPYASPEPSPFIRDDGGLFRTDFILLALFCMVLFGYAMFSGRPLTLHEARLPECSREMLATHDWLIPRSGGRPWLERPPLPHWVTIATSLLLGQRCDSVWVVRLPVALMGTIIALLTAWMAGRFFGRWIGLASALLLATMFEFHQYATLAEDDIYLAALVMSALACFVKAEFFTAAPVGETPERRESFPGRRSWPVLWFYIFVGLTNLVKGPLVGAVITAGIVGSYALLRIFTDGDWRTLRRYLWLWGLLLFAALTVAWPAAVAQKYPEVVKNWLFDYSDTTQYDQPGWYYFPTLLGTIAPWTPLALIAFYPLYRLLRAEQRNVATFLFCWLLVPLLVLSIPHRKHHHYLVPWLAPWGILSAIGCAMIFRSMFRGDDARRRASRLGLTVIALTAIGYCAGTTLFAAKSDHTLDDTAFLERVNREASPDLPLMINASSRSAKNGIELDFFRIQFYLPPSATLLHNLTFLRADDLHTGTVYVITRLNDQPWLETLGQVQIIDQSKKTRGETDPSDRFTLFKLTFRAGLQRYPRPQRITTLQAMGREKGPWCGPPMDAATVTTQPEK